MAVNPRDGLWPSELGSAADIQKGSCPEGILVVEETSAREAVSK